MKTRILVLMIAFAACAIPQQAFSVVVNKDNPAAGISKAQLRKMMMGETPAWPGGAKVLVLMGPAGDGSRSAALKDICGMSESDYSKQALQASFAGGGKSPVRTLPSTAAVRQAVALSPGGIGIVEGTQGGPGLKLLPIE
jgi:ABC-type phosphate transport system substrate-binding protein